MSRLSRAHYGFLPGGDVDLSMPLTVPNVQQGVHMAANVSAVNEAPELTARSAEGFPRPILIDTFQRLPWQGREAADALTQRVMCCVFVPGDGDTADRQLKRHSTRIRAL